MTVDSTIKLPAQLLKIQQAFALKFKEKTALEKAVQSLFDADFDETNLKICQSKMTEVRDAYLPLENTQNFLLEFNDIRLEAKKAWRNPDLQAKTQVMNRLQSRLTKLNTDHPNLSSKNSERVSRLFSKLIPTYVPKSKSNGNQSNLQPTSTSNLSVRELKTAQDAEFAETQSIDKLKDQLKNLNNDLQHDFDILLPLYLKVYIQALNTQFPTNKQTIDAFFKEIKAKLEKCIQDQKAKETASAAQTQAQPALNPAFKKLVDLIENMITKGTTHSDYPTLHRQVETDFATLSEQDKALLLKEFSAVTKKNFPEGLIKQKFAMWGFLEKATLEDKKEALERVIRKGPASASSASQKSVEMESRFRKVEEEIQKKGLATISNRFPDSSTTTTTSTAPSASPSRSPSTSSSVAPAPLALLSTQEVLTELSEIHNLYKDNDQSQNKNAAQRLVKLTQTSPFLNGNKEKEIGDRPNFHVWCIHKKPTGDLNYGSKVMAGELNGTQLERRRALERTMLELLMLSLEDALNFQNGPLTCQCLDMIEKVHLDNADKIGHLDIFPYLSQVASKQGIDILKMRRVNPELYAQQMRTIEEVKKALIGAWKLS